MRMVARRHLRDLIKLIDRRQRRIVYTDFVDDMGDELRLFFPDSPTQTSLRTFA